VRVGFLHPSSSNGCKTTKCLAQHKGAAHKVNITSSWYLPNFQTTAGVSFGHDHDGLIFIGHFVMTNFYL